MIIIPILLAFCSGLLLVWLCNQHKHINIFEQIVLWFVAALALFVFELFLQGVIFNHLSLLFPIITFVVLLCMFIYKSRKQSWYLQEILTAVKTNFLDMWKQFITLKSWKKYLVLWILVYVLVKVFMLFSINVSMPTYSDDAIIGRDMTTKIFSIHKSLVLDTTSPEYFGTDYGRYPFAGITDTYFLLPYGWFVNWLSNIISALMYLFALLLLFGIFVRKTNIFVAALSWYVFTSLPFVFIHGFGSYWNFPAWVFIFIFVFYLIDQLFHLEKEYWGNAGILLPILFVWFLSSVTRNEWVMLTGITFLAIIFFYHVFKKNKTHEIKYQFRPLIPVVLWYIIDKIIFNFYPAWSILNTWGTQINADLVNTFFTNLSKPWVFVAPFQQMFYHPDYILLFIIFVLSLIFFGIWYKKFKEYRIWMIVIFLLFAIFLFILYANLALWLLTHFAFIRYPVSMILFLVYFIWSILYLTYEHKKT